MVLHPVTLPAGVEPGLRFAALLDGKGGCRNLDWSGLRAWQAGQGFLWVHLERDAPEAIRWIEERSGIDPLIADTLLAEESRPRIEAVEDSLLLILRGVNLADRNSLEMVPIHIWIDGTRALTLRDKAHALTALTDIRMALTAGRGPKTAGALLAQIADKIGRDLEPVLDQMEDEVEALEDQVMDSASENLRRNLADVRRRAIHLRRYLGPQRDALYRLRHEDTTLLDERDRMRLRGVIDRVVRHIEDLDAFRDRTTILHEDLAALISEKIAKTTHRFTAIAALLLPPSLIAGMLGANIGGIPGSDDPYAFFKVLSIIVTLLLLQWWLLRRIRWL
jgi:zinc transporter